MLSRTLLLLLALTLVTSFYGADVSLAQCDPGFVPAESQGACVPLVTNGGILPGPSNGSTARSYLLGRFLPSLTNSFLVFYMVVGVVFLIAAGFMFLLASGDEEMRTKARETMVWSIVGLAVGALAYLAVQLVININFFA